MMIDEDDVPMSVWRRPGLLFLSALLWAAALGAAALTLWPFESVVFLRKNSLRFNGVARVDVGTLKAYEYDSCPAKGPCSCVALIHGLGDSALTWDNVLAGKHGASPPPPGTHLLAVEYPGSEGSAPPATPAGYDVPAMAETVGAALEGRCPRWTVAGNSLGGWVSAWIALQRPALVERLVLIDAAGLSDHREELESAARTLSSPTEEGMKRFVGLSYHRHPPIPKRAWRAIVASIRARPTASIVAALKESDFLDARAKDIRAPTLVLWGESDGVISADVGSHFARLIPNARLELVPDCGHLPQQECPAAVSKALFEPR